MAKISFHYEDDEYYEDEYEDRQKARGRHKDHRKGTPKKGFDADDDDEIYVLK